jgi:hypothetical protein
MALTPQTKDMLDQALTAVIGECGNDPEYADLIAALQSAHEALAHIHPGGAGHPAAADQGQQPDAHSFDYAQQQMTARRKGAQ